MVIGGGDEPESPANDTTFKLKEFVPTNEWQIIENGTPRLVRYGFIYGFPINGIAAMFKHIC